MTARRPLESLVHLASEFEVYVYCRSGKVASLPWSDCFTEITCPACKARVSARLLSLHRATEASA